MVVTRIRQAGSLKPQVKVREIAGRTSGDAPYKVSDGALRGILPIYKRSDSLMSHCGHS